MQQRVGPRHELVGEEGESGNEAGRRELHLALHSDERWIRLQLVDEVGVLVLMRERLAYGHGPTQELTQGFPPLLQVEDEQLVFWSSLRKWGFLGVTSKGSRARLIGQRISTSLARRTTLHLASGARHSTTRVNTF